MNTTYKQTVVKNLEQDRHYYDDFVSAFIQCRKCNGTGELYQDIGEWESEGGPSVPNNQCDCIKEKLVITDDMVKRFFELPIASKNVKITSTRSGVCGFDIHIYVTLNPALQDEVAELFDVLLSDIKNNEWLIGEFKWSINYEVGVSYRHFSGAAKEAQLLIQKWEQNCKKKFGKNLESQIRVFL